MFYCGHNKIIVATVAPPVDHSLAQQELDIFTIWKISFIVVLLWNCGTTGTELIYYLKNKIYCGIYCGFTISVNKLVGTYNSWAALSFEFLPEQIL